MLKSFLFSLLVATCANAKTITLTASNTVAIRGPVSGRSVGEWSEKVVTLHLKRAGASTPIYLVLDTPGGDIDAGLSFINFVRTIPNVETISIFAASMGSGIVEGLPGTRYVTSNGILMFHRATVGLEGQINSGEFESRLSMVKRVVDTFENQNAQRMCMSKDAYSAAVKDELWLIGKEAVHRRAADAIVDIKCADELLSSSTTSTISFFIFSFKVQFSSCPLLRSGRAAQADEKNYNLYLESLKSK